MDNLNNLDIKNILKKMKEHSISKEDLKRFIESINGNNIETEELREFLETAEEYMNEEVVEVSEETLPSDSGSEPTEVSEEIPILSDEDKPVISSDINIESSEEKEEYPVIDVDTDSYKEAVTSMSEVYRYSNVSGLNVKEISPSGVGGRGPYITFEINHESKQILDHLMNELYYSSNGISLELLRNQFKNEFFTIEVDPGSMSEEEVYQKTKETFDDIYHLIETTKMDYDYEKDMPDNLQNIKGHFYNDAPDIDGDITIGYNASDGKETYYIVSSDYETAISYAASIGYDVKRSVGSNIYEVDTENNISESKLAKSAVNLETDSEVHDIRQNGVSDIDIYGSLETDPKVEEITNFIETSNDSHIMSFLEVEIPVDNKSQRIVRLKDETGVDSVVVFPDGDNFDKHVMPEIIDTYRENNEVDEGNIERSESSCQIESENNTTLIINNYSNEEIDKVTSFLSMKEESKTNEKSYQKTLGTYKESVSSDDNDKAFVSLSVLLVICVLFILMISLIVFSS